MSEKYSMNELLAWIEKQCSLVDGEWGCASSCEDECKGPKDAIIAQLRAADKMYGAAKRMNEDIFDTGKTKFITVALFHINKIRKAIAEYERREKK